MSNPVRIVLQLFGLLPDGSSAAAKLTADQRLQVSTGLAQPTTPTDTQPVSAAALPLPNGAATSINQDITNTALGKQVVEAGGDSVESSHIDTLVNVTLRRAQYCERLRPSVLHRWCQWLDR